MSLLSICGVAIAVGASIALLSIHSAAEKETRRVQRDIGFNLRIISKESSVESLFLNGYASETMSEQVLDKLANHKTIAYNHLVGMLQEPIELRGGTALLTGLSPTRFPPGNKRPPMSPTIKPGTAHLGRMIADRLEVARGESLSIEGQEFEVARVAPESGTSDDLRVWVHLHDAQAILNKPNQINEVRAIDCLCLAADQEPQALLRRVIEKVAPEAQVAMLTQIASARAQQRQLLERIVAYSIPAVAIASSLLVGVLALINARQRRQELGVLRAIGYGSGAIAGLMLAKAVVIGLAGGAAGCLLGAIVAGQYVPEVATITGHKFQLNSVWLAAALIIAPVMACVASLAAATWAVSQSPVDLLRDS